MKDMIDEVVTRLGLGPMAGETERYVGRNANVSGMTESGRRVFVKRIHGASDVRFARNVAFEQRAGDTPARPRLIGHDETHRMLVYEYVPEAESPGVLARTEKLDPELTRAMGREVAALHAVPLDGIQTAPHALPAMHYFGELSLDVFLGMTAGELELVRLLQADPALADAVRRIRTVEDAGEYDLSYIHADLRLDQMLVSDGRLLLADFEDARAGDPARDLGSLIGDLLYVAILSIPRRVSQGAGEGPVSHAEIMAAGGAAIDDVLPLVHALVEGYEAEGTAIAGDLRTRTLRFAGWHMFDRLFATAESAFRLDGAVKAAAGIGRSLMIAPDDFAELLSADALEAAA